MKKQARSVASSIDDEIDTIPSRLDQLTTRSRLEEKARNEAGWRRNVLMGALVVLVLVAIYLNR